MRTISLLPIAAALASCTTATAPPMHAEAEARLHQELAGLVPGQPQTCLPAYSRNGMTVIDDTTILFRDGPNRVWRNEVKGACNMAGLGRTLVFRTTSTSLCNSDIAEVVQLPSNTTFGTCVLGDFIPYTRP